MVLVTLKLQLQEIKDGLQAAAAMLKLKLMVSHMPVLTAEKQQI